MLLGAAVDVEVEGIKIQVLPCVVVVDSEDVISDDVVLLEPDVLVDAAVVGFKVVDMVSVVPSVGATVDLVVDLVVI